MPLHLAVNISRDSDESLTSQIQKFIKKEIQQGTLHPGTRLPATRRLAEDLRISRSVVVEAYAQLAAEGYLEAARGAGTRVTGHLSRDAVVPALLDEGPVPAVRWDLRPGGHNAPGVPHKEWLTAYQRVLLSPKSRGTSYPSLAGEPELRVELARHLGRLRGVRATPSTVLVVGGFAQTLALLCAALPATGITELAVEDPCHPGQRRFVQDSGMRGVPVPVDDEGIDVDALAATRARAVLVTPAHQFPTGAVLSDRRREALVRWARAVDGWVIEDDYDGGLWYDDQHPRPLALQRLEPERVIYAGTASKLLDPGLRLGWLTAPEELLHRLLHVRGRHDLGTESFTQLALADLLRGGLFDRHLRRLTERCAARREALDQAVRARLPGATVLGPAAGLHAYVRLPAHTDEAALVAGALRRGVLVRGGAAFGAVPRRETPALVVGHAHLPLSGVSEAFQELGAVAGRG
ncbi:GntR family transcriptional regulator [Streptomyces sp. SA15]|uniref:MocR-like pyridoxine biosynthesis transcription factor PdxR n=1 Tax=Streptomyces sp. SA15 TaxID=934019 RepID=UPI000BB01FA4|nr:PLP-dependent aminotransferase family protein [Streptomyces sp. SA15]PAZ14313.1 GntR family transcriptional regulator [Streptomyces sp. SA15]